MNGITDRVAIVTGAASNIGRVTAERLADEGATVAVVDIDEDGGRKTVNQIQDKGGDGAFYRCDVTDVDAVESVVDEIEDDLRTPTLLVNSVGGSSCVKLEDTDEGEFHANINRNLKSAFFMTKAVLPQMRDCGDGRVIFVSSINAEIGGFSETAYAAAKNGLHALTRSLTADYADEGIRFNAVCLGTIVGENPQWDERAGGMDVEDGEAMKEALESIYPLGRLGNPEDAAAAITFLLSDEADWIAGEVLTVDGGATATGNLPGGRWWEKL